MARANVFTYSSYSLKKLSGDGDLQHPHTAGANNNQEWTSSTRTQCLRISHDLASFVLTLFFVISLSLPSFVVTMPLNGHTTMIVITVKFNSFIKVFWSHVMNRWKLCNDCNGSSTASVQSHFDASPSKCKADQSSLKKAFDLLRPAHVEIHNASNLIVKCSTRCT